MSRARGLIVQVWPRPLRPRARSLRMSARIQTRADLEKYIGHFNARRYDEQIAYYAPDVIYKVGTLTLTSPRQIADFYADFHQYVKEHVELVQLAIDGDS